MKSVRIVCPECSSFIEFDGTKSRNLCECGYEVPDDPVKMTAAFKTAISNLSAQLKKNYDADKITEACDRILGIDGHYSDAWVYKGMASEDMSEKFSCYYNCVIYMNEKEYDDCYETLSDDIVESLNDYEGEWDSVDVAMLDLVFREKKPSRSKKDGFLKTVIAKVKKKILVIEDTNHVRLNFAAYIRLVTASVMLCPDIEDQIKALSPTIDEIDKFHNTFRRVKPEETNGYSIDHIADYIKSGGRFIGQIISELESRVKKLDSRDIEELEVLWKETELTPLVSKLVDSFRLNDKSFFAEYDSVVEEQDALIAEYADEYLKPIERQPELPKVQELPKEPEIEEGDPVKRIVKAKGGKAVAAQIIAESEEEEEAEEEVEEEEPEEEAEEEDVNAHRGEIAYMTTKDGDYTKDYKKIIKSCKKLSNKEIFKIIDDSYYQICDELGGLDAVFIPGHEFMEWAKFCAENEYPRAMLDYGVCLLKGFGVEKDETLGKIYLKKASEANYYEATFILNDLTGCTSTIFKTRLSKQTQDMDAAVIIDIYELH